MDFEYHKEIIKLNPKCPPADYSPVEAEAFRWVFKKMDNPNNFLPRIKMRPKAFNDKSDLEKCLGYGLSMFVSEKSSTDRFKILYENFGELVFDWFGTHVAKGNIIKDDGVSSA